MAAFCWITWPHDSACCLIPSWLSDITLSLSTRGSSPPALRYNGCSMPHFAPVTRTAALEGLLLRPETTRCTLRLSPRRQGNRRSRCMSPRALSPQDELKQKAAWRAVDYVKSGMKLGLGTGSTAAFAVDRIGDLLKSGELKDIVAVPTSIKTREQADSKSSLVCRRHG